VGGGPGRRVEGKVQGKSPWNRDTGLITAQHMTRLDGHPGQPEHPPWPENTVALLLDFSKKHKKISPFTLSPVWPIGPR